MINYFISHTLFQSYVASLMIETLPEFIGKENVIISPAERLHAGTGSWSRVVTPSLDLFTRGNFIGVGENINISRGIIRELDEHECARLLICNLWSPFNRILSGLASRKRRIELCIYPEGLANLLVPRVNGMERVKEFCKSVMLKLQGIPYDYTSYTSGEHRASAVYTFCPELLLKAGLPGVEIRKVVLPDHASGSPMDRGNCLIIGQGCDNVFTAGEIARCQDILARIISGSGCSNVYYKTHPLSRVVDKALAVDGNVQVIDDNRLAEVMIDELDCGLVVSIYSSALFNLKQMYGDRIRCVSINGDLPIARHYMYGPGKAEWYSTICKAYGVELLH